MAFIYCSFFGSTDIDIAHNAHNMCIMKNLTLRVEASTLAKARQIAAERATSVNAFVREFLDDLVNQQSRKEKARKEILALCENPHFVVGNRNWTREEIYDR